jgi:hypothetical protein
VRVTLVLTAVTLVALVLAAVALVLARSKRTFPGRADEHDFR